MFKIKIRFSSAKLAKILVNITMVFSPNTNAIFDHPDLKILKY